MRDNVFDLRFDPFIGDWSEQPRVIHRLLKTKQWLLEQVEKGIYDKALVIFLSDHGEGLGDHGEAEHGMFLYREALQVPLLVPRRAAGRGHVRARGAPAYRWDFC